MINFKKFMELYAEKKCPPGYKFDTKKKYAYQLDKEVMYLTMV